MNKIKNSEISIILPTLNEGKNLEFLIPDIFKFLSSKIERFEIIIVDDGSTDNTYEICRYFTDREYNLKLIKRNPPASLPISIYEGIDHATTNNVMWLDADGSMPVVALEKLVNKFFIDERKVIVGSRFIQGGGYKGVSDLNTSFIKAIKNVRNSNDSVFGMVLSIYFNKFLARVFKSPVSDLTSGFIVGNKSRFKKDFFEKSNYGEYFIYLIKDLINDNVSIEEVGYICETRVYGVSKTASSLYQLINRGIPYIKAAYNCRKGF